MNEKNQLFDGILSPIIPDLQRRLIELGIREMYDNPIELHSGIMSDVFWDVEKLFQYPSWIITEALRPFIWRIGILKPAQLVGIPSGGLMLANWIGKLIDRWPVLSSEKTYLTHAYPQVLIDDVMTTGETVKSYIRGKLGEYRPDHIAVLINRSDITEIEGVSVLSGISVDNVAEQSMH